MSQEQPRVYVIRRNEFAEGAPAETPFVVAECAQITVEGDGFSLAEDLDHDGVFTRQQMLADPALARALEAWEEGDDSLWQQESDANLTVIDAVRVIRDVDLGGEESGR